MIVEPVPAGGDGARKRGLRMLAIVVPVGLFAAVLVVGVLGPRSRGVPNASTPAASGAPATASPDGSGAPAFVPPIDEAATPWTTWLPSAGTTGPGDPSATAAFPAAIETLPVRPVESLGEAEPARGSIVAVAGRLLLTAVDGCSHTTAPDAATFCARPASLRTVDGSPGIVLAVPAGVRLPRGSFPPEGPQSAGPPGVVVVALVRIRDDGYLLERVAWLDGARWRAPSIDPALGRNPFDEGWWQRRLDAEAALGLSARNGSVVMLVTAYARLDAIEAADPAVADAVRRDAPASASHALWFVRALFPGGVGEGSPRRDEIRWLVVDDWTGAVIGRGAG